MKTLLLLLLAVCGLQQAMSQTCTATITASGPTTFCEGGSVVLSTNAVADSGAWTKMTNFISARSGASGFSIGNKGYLGTGYDPVTEYKKDFWEYDPATNAWTQKADFGGSLRYDATSFSIGNKGYIGAGYDPNAGYMNDFWEYDPASNTWTQKANFGSPARQGAKGFSIGNKGYVGTGYNPNAGYSNEFWEYDPASDTWAQKANFGGTARTYAVGFSIGNKGYIGTGIDRNFNRNDFWEYDPVTDTWTQKADCSNTGRSLAFGFSMGNKGYIGTGIATTVYKNDFWEYDPLSNTWTQKATYAGTARMYSSGFSIDNKAYVGIGVDMYTGYRNDIWEYDPGISFLWSTGETTPTITVTQSGNYSVTITGGDGCSATSEVTAVTVNAEAAIASVTASSNPICLGNTTTLTANGVAGTNASINWYTNPTGSGTNLGTGNTLPNRTTGTYYARVTADCGVPVEASLMVTLATLPTPTITAAGPTTFCEGGNVSLSTANTIGGDLWLQKANFGGAPRDGAVSFSIGDKGYIGTGDALVVQKDFWEFNPATNVWTQKADFGGDPRVYAVGLSIGNKGYIGLGQDYTAPYFKNDFWEYDPESNTWTRKADFSGVARTEAAAFSIGSKGYIGTGSLRNDFWEYNPAAETWTQKADFGGSGRFGAASFSIGNKGYIGAGKESVDLGVGFKNDFWEYDPSQDSWTKKADFGGTARARTMHFSIGNRGYIGLGYDIDIYPKDVWEYNPTLNTWTQKVNFVGTPRVRSISMCIGNKGYVGTGYIGQRLAKDFWEYDPGYTYAWSTGETTPAITVANTGSYTVSIANSAGCSTTSAATVVTVEPTPEMDTPENQIVCNGIATTAVAFTGGTSGTKYSWTNDNTSIGLAAKGSGNIASFTAPNTGNTPLAATITVTPSSGGYFAYIPNRSSGNVSVINTKTNEVVTTIPVGTDPIGASVSPDGRYVYISNEGSSNVSKINTATNTVEATFGGVIVPHGILVSPDGSRLYVVNSWTGNSVSVFNTSTNNLIATIPVGNVPIGVASNTDGSRIYVSNTYSNSVSVINTSTNTVINTIAVGSFPHGILVSPDGSRVYVVNSSSNNISVINTATNAVINSIPVGGGPISITSNAEGNILYTTNQHTDNITVVNTLINSVTATIPVGDDPAGISLNYDGSRAYVTNLNSNNVTVINTVTNEVIASISVGAYPYSYGNFITNNLVCKGASKTFTITVNPIPDVATPSNQTKCNNTSIDAINFSGTVSGTAFKWTNDNTGIGLAASGTGNISAFTALNTSTVPLVANLTVTPEANGCSGTPVTFTITINPTPVTPIVNVVNNCGNSVLSTTATGNLLWSTGATTSSITVTTAGNYTVSQTAGGCSSLAGSGLATPNPQPSAPIIKVDNNCGFSILSTTSTGTLLWSTGATSNAINVRSAGTYTVTRTVNGCTSTVSSAVAAPSAAPVLTVNNISVVPATNTCSASVAFASGVSVTGLPTPSLLYAIGTTAITSPYIFPVGATNVNVTAFNSCGTVKKTMIVRVNDNQPPVIVCKPGTTRSSKAAVYLVSGTEFDATATDNCGKPVLTYSLSGATVAGYNARKNTLAQEKLNIGTTTITWRATDESNNVSTCTTVVTITRTQSNNVTTGPSVITNTFSGTTPASEKTNSISAKVIPNPTVSYFTIELKSNSMEKLSITVVDVAGRKIDQKINVQPNSTLQLGSNYEKGIYFAEVIQGKEKVMLKLIKAGN